jgi:hypothetical protein
MSDSASQHRRPQKGQKIDVDFCQFFLHFWLRLLDVVLMNSVHRSEVNIYRVMTRNVSEVFKEESTLWVEAFGTELFFFFL